MSKTGKRSAQPLESQKAMAKVVSAISDLYLEDPVEFDRQWKRMRKAGRLG